MNRRLTSIGLVVAAAAALVIGIVVLVPGNTSEQLDTTAAPQARAQTGVQAIWPFASSPTRFATPEDAARSFAVDYLGMTNAQLGATTPGADVTTVEVIPRPGATLRTVVDVVQRSSGDWVVTGANADEIIVEEPRPGDVITSPLTVSGEALAFEAQLGLELRPLGSTAVVATASALGGGSERLPFSTTITPPSTTQQFVLIVSEADASGEQTFSQATVLLLGANPVARTG
jgi:hypothetical protein